MKKIVFKSLYQLGKMIPSTGIPVLLYHSVVDKPNWPGAISKKNFEQQISWLAQNYTCVTLADVLQWTQFKVSLPSNSVALSFDDGYRDNLTMVAPILKKHKITATLFTVTQPDTATYMHGKTLTIQELKKLQENGWDIQSHTTTHPELPSLSKKEIQHQLFESKKWIQQKLKKDAFMLAYPKGKYSDKAIKFAKRYYQASWTTNAALVQKGDNFSRAAC